MNIDQKIAELDKHIQYIEKVLKEKQDERFCLIAEKRGTRPLVTRKLRLKMVALLLVVGSCLNPQLKDNS